MLTEPTGVIDMRNETRALHWFSTYSRLECEWNITVRAGRTIAVEFPVFNVPSLDVTHCAQNYVVVSVGLRATNTIFSMELLHTCSSFVFRVKKYHVLLEYFSQEHLICGNKMPTRCNRSFYCRSYCLLSMFGAPLCPSSGAQEYYTVVAACGISCYSFQVAGLQ